MIYIYKIFTNGLWNLRNVVPKICSFQITWKTTLRQNSLAEAQFSLHIYCRTKFIRTSQDGFKFLQNTYPKNIVKEVFSLKVFLGASRTKD